MTSLGNHVGGLRTTFSDLETVLGAIGGHLEAMLEVLGAILVDSLGVIEVYECQDRWHDWEVQFFSCFAKVLAGPRSHLGGLMA